MRADARSGYLLGSEKGGELELLNEAHRACLSAFAYAEGGMLRLHEGSGEVMASLSANGDSGLLTVFGNFGEQAVTLCCERNRRSRAHLRQRRCRDGDRHQRRLGCLGRKSRTARGGNSRRAAPARRQEEEDKKIFRFRIDAAIRPATLRAPLASRKGIEAGAPRGAVGSPSDDQVIF